MPRLRLIADDITGALDSAVKFAGPELDIEVSWDLPVGTGSFAYDTETREATARDAFDKVSAALPFLRDADIAFKKIDSLIRGNTAIELAACAQSGAFDNIVIAPAYPALGRVTQGGRQYAIDGVVPGNEVGLRPSLQASLEVLGVNTTVYSPGAESRKQGVYICDADSDADLLAAVAFGRSLPGTTLWCGSGGLAGVLASSGERRAMRIDGPVLVIAGSDSPRVERQLSVLGDERQFESLVVKEEGDLRDRLAIRLFQGLERGLDTFLRFAWTGNLPRAKAAAQMSTFFELMASHRLPKPGALVLCGGETAVRLFRAMGARKVSPRDEVVPGAPVSIIRGGPWSGTVVVTKSGSFGDDNVFVEIVNNLFKG
ncbi:MAG: Hrp-dependent type III effector protein [Proteobacteria bacterium]|nr:MAG: Hrp-dependent type III effector protein [Pseudomonadota bacterium]